MTQQCDHDMYGVAPIKDVLEGAVGFVMSVDHARERAKVEFPHERFWHAADRRWRLTSVMCTIPFCHLQLVYIYSDDEDDA